MTPNILILGYGISFNRPEAISLSTRHMATVCRQLGYEVTIVSLDALTGSTSLFHNLIHYPQIYQFLKNKVSQKNYTHLVDVFALPLSSLIFTTPIVKLFPNLIYLKEFQNDAGHSHTLSLETIIRILSNNQYVFNYINRLASVRFTRNLSLSQKYNFAYLPSNITLSRSSKPQSTKLQIGYLGHPLRKKGVWIFPDLIRHLKGYGDRVEFNFAFSNLGNPSSLSLAILAAGREANIKIAVMGVVNSRTFFLKNHIYLLPIQDQFGAASTPNTVLEAMASGCVVATVSTPSVEGVVSPDNSILLDSRDPERIAKELIKFIEKRSLLDGKVKHARQLLLRQYTRSIYYRALKNIYATQKL